MKMKRLAVATITMVAALGMSKVALSEAGLSYTTADSNPDPVTANVKFKVTIPKVMILRVGDWGSSVNEVSWAYKFGLASIADPSANIDGTAAHWAAANGAAGVDADADTEASSDKAAAGTLNIWAFSNVGGNVQITASPTDFQRVDSTGTAAPIAGARQPHLSEITVTATNDVHHPVFSNDSDTAGSPIVATDGVVAKQGTWKYNYTPAAGAPVAGIYEAEVTYTMAAL